MKNPIQGLGETATNLFRKTMIKAVSLGDTVGGILSGIGSILKLSLDRSLTNARTEFYNSFREGFREQLQEYEGENNKIGWIWRAEKDVKTCIICLTLDGTKHSLDEDMQSHPNCRCQMEIDYENEIRENDGLQWFKDRSEEEQQAILGKGKYEAWRNGELAIHDLIGVDDSGYYYEKPLKDVLERKNIA